MSCYLGVLLQRFQWIIHEAWSWNENFIHCPFWWRSASFLTWSRFIIARSCRQKNLILRARKKEKNASCNKIKGFRIFSRLLMRSTSGPYSWLQLLLNSPHMWSELFRNRFCHSVSINVFMFSTKWKQNRAKISQNLCECLSLSLCFWQLFTFIFKCKLYGTVPFYVH